MLNVQTPSWSLHPTATKKTHPELIYHYRVIHQHFFSEEQVGMLSISNHLSYSVFQVLWRLLQAPPFHQACCVSEASALSICLAFKYFYWDLNQPNEDQVTLFRTGLLTINQPNEDQVTSVRTCLLKINQPNEDQVTSVCTNLFTVPSLHLSTSVQDQLPSSVFDLNLFFIQSN